MLRLSRVVTVAVLVVGGVESQEAWTRRRGRNNKVRPQVDVEEPDPSIYGNFAEMNEMAAAAPTKKGRRSRSASRDRMAAMAGNPYAGLAGMEGMEQYGQLMQQMMGGEGMEMMQQLMQQMGGADMENMMQKIMSGEMDIGQLMAQGIDMWSDAMDTPEMQAMLNDPEQLRATMAPFLEMFGGDMEKMDELLQNPAEMQAKMKEGMQQAKELFSDPSKLAEMQQGFMELLNDPTKMAEMQAAMLEGLDPSTKAQVEALANGDMSALTDALGDLGLGDADGKEMADLLEALSDPAKLNSEMAKLMADPAFADSEMGQQLKDLVAAQGGAGISA